MRYGTYNNGKRIHVWVRPDPKDADPNTYTITRCRFLLARVDGTAVHDVDINDINTSYLCPVCTKGRKK